MFLKLPLQLFLERLSIQQESQGPRCNIQFESKLVDNPLDLHPNMCIENLRH